MAIRRNRIIYNGATNMTMYRRRVAVSHLSTFWRRPSVTPCGRWWNAPPPWRPSQTRPRRAVCPASTYNTRPTNDALTILHLATIMRNLYYIFMHQVAALVSPCASSSNTDNTSSMTVHQLAAAVLWYWIRVYWMRFHTLFDNWNCTTFNHPQTSTTLVPGTNFALKILC